MLFFIAGVPKILRRNSGFLFSELWIFHFGVPNLGLLHVVRADGLAGLGSWRIA
jgi:hypothetical protein